MGSSTATRSALALGRAATGGHRNHPRYIPWTGAAATQAAHALGKPLQASPNPRYTPYAPGHEQLHGNHPAYALGSVCENMTTFLSHSLVLAPCCANVVVRLCVAARATYLAIAGLATAQIAASTVLYVRTRRLYRAEYIALRRGALH